MLLILCGEGIVEFVTKPHQGIVYCRLPSLVGYLYIRPLEVFAKKIGGQRGFQAGGARR
jgi:hypothetical protein